MAQRQATPKKQIIGWIVLFVSLIILTWLLVIRQLPVVAYTAASAAWFIGCVLYVIGPETISEVTLGIASIKRNLATSQEILEKVEAMEHEITSAQQKIAQTANEVAAAQRDILGAQEAVGHAQNAAERAQILTASAQQEVTQTRDDLLEALQAVVKNMIYVARASGPAWGPRNTEQEWLQVTTREMSHLIELAQFSVNDATMLNSLVRDIRSASPPPPVIAQP